MPQAGQVTVWGVEGAAGIFITCNFATGRWIKAGKLQKGRAEKQNAGLF
jgi:hypothetical protein